MTGALICCIPTYMLYYTYSSDSFLLWLVTAKTRQRLPTDVCDQFNYRVIFLPSLNLNNFTKPEVVKLSRNTQVKKTNKFREMSKSNNLKTP